MTFGEQLYEALTERSALLNRRLNREEVIAVADVSFSLALVTAPKAPGTPIPANSSQFGDRRKIPPTPELVTAYAASIGFKLDGQAFCDFYASKGWKVGNAKMKDWQACTRTWKVNAIGRSETKQKSRNDYSKI